MKFFEFITYLFCGAGGLLMVAALLASRSAPQEAAGAALALGIAGIPYFICATMQRARIIARLEKREP